MTSRSQMSYSGTYNPQQWGPVRSTSAGPASAENQRPLQSQIIPTLAPRPVGPDGKAITSIQTTD